MDTYREIAEFDQNSPLKIFMHEVRFVGGHYHEGIEILFVLAGEVRISMEQREFRLTEDQLMLINPNQMHELRSEDGVVVILQIQQEFVKQAISPNELPAFECNSALSKDDALFEEVKRVVARMIKYNTEKPSNLRLLNRSLLYKLMFHLMSSFRFVGDDEHSPARQNDRSNRIITYLNENYREYLSLTDLAEKENLSPAYLSRFFRDHLGTTFSAFLSRIRLMHAVNDLVSTQKSITEIAGSVGFPNTRALAAAFREEYGMTPKEYRRDKIQDAGSREMPADYTRIQQSNYLEKIGAYLDTDVTSVIPVRNEFRMVDPGSINMGRSYRTLRKTFRRSLSFGDGEGLLIASTQDMLREAKRDLGFSEIVLTGFFDSELEKYFSDPVSDWHYNFSRSDQIFEAALSFGLRPILKLGLAYHESCFITRLMKNETNFEENLKRWTDLLEAFFRHLVSRFGLEEILQWKFLLQEEYDRQKLVNEDPPQDRFHRLYQATYQVIKSTAPGLRFGPPPLMPYMADEKRIRYFAKYSSENSCEPDFLTMKYFPVIPERGDNPRGFQLSEDPDALEHYINTFNEYRKGSSISHIPVHLTEWNSSPTNTDLLNDTCFKSAYIVRNILKNIDRLDSYGYWILSDDNLDLNGGSELFHGGMGLFTRSGIKKPAYYALQMLGKLGDNFIKAGDGYFITSSAGAYQIIAYNYAHYSNLYAGGERFDMSFTNRYTPFTSQRKMELKLDLNNLVNSDYMMNSWTINREHGSAFDVWQKIFGVETFDRQELELLKAYSAPLLQKRQLSVEDGSLQFTLELEPHEVRLVELIRK